MMDHVATCGSRHRRPIPVARRGRHLVVDIHCHLQIAAAEELIRANVANPPPPGGPISPASSAVMKRLFETIGPRLNGIEQRLVDMDELGIDVQAISPPPNQYYYFTPPELGREAAMLVNDGIAAAVAKRPERLVGMGTVPLQNVPMAIAEMRRCSGELDLRGIEISTNVNGADLSDPQFRPFFAAAEELGILLFMHPLGFFEPARLYEHHLNNIVGNPVESTIALAHLIFGGVLHDHPELKLCVAHGGGYLPAYAGRMDHAYRAREDCRQHIAREPSSYLRQVWLDTLVFDRDQLDFLVRTHGEDRLCLGTDYPFDMAEPSPVPFHDGLADATREKILGLNAAGLLGLAVCAERASS